MRGSLRVAAVILAALVLFLATAVPSPTLATPEPLPAVLPVVVTAAAESASEAPEAIVAVAAATAVPDASIANGYRISIPRLGIDLPIAEGDVQRDIADQRTPEGFAFHLPGTALPGQPGNMYLYAHARRGMFLALWSARPGDEVLVASPDGEVLVYVVREVLPRVAPTDVSSTLPTKTQRLTLQTSTGPSPTDPRFVVFAFPRG